MAATGSEMDVKEEGFVTDSGKIISVEKSGTDGVSVVEIENKMAVCVLQLMQTCLILDRKDGSYKTVADLTEGRDCSGLQQQTALGSELAPLSGQRDSSGAMQMRTI